MSRRGRVLASFVAFLWLALAAPAVVRAATVEELVALASNPQGYAMTCSPSTDGVTCSKTLRVATWWAQVKPASGQEDSLETYAQTSIPLESSSRAWMTDMHQTACGAPTKVADFVNQVGDLQQVGTAIGPASIGTCRFTGGLSPSIEGAPSYHVDSVFVPPPPPTPTPTATPMVTPSPTPQPTPQATPTSTPKPTVTLPPTSTPTSTPVSTSTPAPTTASATASASASASPAASSSPSASPASPAPTTAETFQPTQQVAAATDAPGESQPPPAAPPPMRPPTFADSVRAIDAVSTNADALGGSLLLALALLLIVGFAGELFNNTVENNYDRIAAWFRRRPLSWLGSLFGGRGRFAILAFIALTALISSFVDPSLGLDLRSLAVFLGFLVGLIVVLASFKLPPMLAHRRVTGDLGRLRPLPWALVIAALFVLVSRLANLQPGYLYGIVLGAIFVADVSDAEEGRETFFGSVWTLVAAALSWLALGWVRSTGGDPDGFVETLLSTAFAAILVAGLEATAFGLMPLKFMPGYGVYRWNRLGWALLFGLSVFAFVHILIGPTSGYVSQLSPTAFFAALGAFAAFGALSIATWLYFRLRPTPAEA